MNEYFLCHRGYGGQIVCSQRRGKSRPEVLADLAYCREVDARMGFHPVRLVALRLKPAR